MQTALLILHIVLAVAMIAVVLVQKSDGGALGMGGGGAGGGFMSVRGTANLLTRTTAVLAGLFFAMTLALAVLFKGGQGHTSLVDDASVQQQQEQAVKKEAVAPVVPKAAPAPALTGKEHKKK